MIVLCLLVINAYSTDSAPSNYEILYSDGWVPISVDKVFNVKPGPISYNTQTIEKTNSDENMGIINLNVLKKPEAVVEKEIVFEDDSDHYFEVKCDDGSDYCENNKEDTKIIETNFIPNAFDIQEINDSIESNKPRRRSKKLSDVFRVNNKIIDLDNQVESNQKLSTYEVVEKIDDDVPQPVQDKQSGYYYEPPNNNFINQLVSVLLKYNIRINDELPHYALSRRNKAQTYMKPDYGKPLQVEVPYKSNSLNHLPVDPLLAVFLSNYGYYLQGRYGIQNNYNNLYGYSASNNIHNNKPFGLYKLFSDTDSSN